MDSQPSAVLPGSDRDWPSESQTPVVQLGGGPQSPTQENAAQLRARLLRMIVANEKLRTAKSTDSQSPR